MLESSACFWLLSSHMGDSQQLPKGPSGEVTCLDAGLTASPAVHLQLKNSRWLLSPLKETQCSGQHLRVWSM